MIDDNLARGFEAQIAATESAIAATRELLQDEEGRDNAEQLRVRIKYSEKLLAAVTNGRNAILAASFAVGEMEAKFIRWRAICDEARAAEAEMHRIEQEFGPARDACVPAENLVAHAEAELQEHRNVPLPRFATEPERGRKAAEEEKLRLALEEARAQLRAAVAEHERPRRMATSSNKVQ